MWRISKFILVLISLFSLNGFALAEELSPQHFANIRYVAGLSEGQCMRSAGRLVLDPPTAIVELRSCLREITAQNVDGVYMNCMSQLKQRNIVPEKSDVAMLVNSRKIAEELFASVQNELQATELASTRLTGEEKLGIVRVECSKADSATGKPAGFSIYAAVGSAGARLLLTDKR